MKVTFELTVLYPTRFMHVGQIGNPTYAVELCPPYNDYLNDQILDPRQAIARHGAVTVAGAESGGQGTAAGGQKYGVVGGILPAEGL